jgi:thiamine pyrophosphokinase
MATEYVSRVFLSINGQEVTDFKSVTEKAIELYKEVRLMNKTGAMSVKPRYGAQVEYVVPENAPEFNFFGVKDGTLTIELQNGKRITFTGVYPLTIGEVKYDGDNESVRTIDFMAAGRVEE